MSTEFDSPGPGALKQGKCDFIDKGKSVKSVEVELEDVDG